MHAICAGASAALLLGGLPVLMVFANRSSAAILTFAALCAILGLFFHPDRPSLLPRVLERARSAIRGPIGLLLLAFFALALAGIVRTAHPGFNLWRLGEAAVPLLATAVLVLIQPFRPLPVRFGWLAFGLVAAVALIFVEQASPGSIRGLFGLREELWRLNRALVTLVLLLPVLVVLAERAWQRWLAGLIGLLVFLASIRSDSASSTLAALALLIGTLPSMLNWIWFSRLALAGTLLALFSAPVHGWLLYHAIPDWVHEQLRSASSAIRVSIYRAFDAAIATAPVFGSGFNASTRFRDEPGFQRVPADLQSFIGFGHPHNAAVQLWVEMGLAGAIIIGALILFAFRRIDALPPAMRPWALGFWAAVVAVSLVSHGAWQAWWLALVGTGVVLFVARAAQIRARQPLDPG